MIRLLPNKNLKVTQWILVATPLISYNYYYGYSEKKKIVNHFREINFRKNENKPNKQIENLGFWNQDLLSPIKPLTVMVLNQPSKVLKVTKNI